MSSTVGGTCVHGIPFGVRCWTCFPWNAADTASSPSPTITTTLDNSGLILACLTRIEALLHEIAGHDRIQAAGQERTADE